MTGDGYDGNKSPHSPREKFEGVSLGRAALVWIATCNYYIFESQLVITSLIIDGALWPD